MERTSGAKKPMRRYVAYGKRGAIQAAVWRTPRQHKSGKVSYFPSVSIGRRYVDRETNEWRSSNSYTCDDLVKLREVLDRIIQDLELPFEGADAIRHSEPEREPHPASVGWAPKGQDGETCVV